MTSKSVIHSDPEILGGTPVFVGTRVPVRTLLDYLEAGDSLSEFLEDFPSVTRDQAVAYAQAQGIAYEVEAPAARAEMKPKVYAENFRFGRAENWSH